MNTRQIRERLRSAPACAPNTVGERFDRGWRTAWAVFLLWAATAIASPAQTFTTLANFNGANADPVGTLAQGSDGNFYGTTFGDQETGFAGTVFKMTPTGTLTTLYGFCSQGGCVDGAAPLAGLIEGKDGAFYGTTYGGGANSSGTVFKITRAGKLTTLYSFCNGSGCAEGAGPSAALVEGSDGNFYRTTTEFGAGNSGTVFKMTPAGILTTLYSFCSKAGCADGAVPSAALVEEATAISTGQLIRAETLITPARYSKSRRREP
jgi:uncharacterized repeat protein (TIGR03803 family)